MLFNDVGSVCLGESVNVFAARYILSGTYAVSRRVGLYMLFMFESLNVRLVCMLNVLNMCLVRNVCECVLSVLYVCIRFVSTAFTFEFRSRSSWYTKLNLSNVLFEVWLV